MLPRDPGDNDRFYLQQWTLWPFNSNWHCCHGWLYDVQWTQWKNELLCLFCSFLSWLEVIRRRLSHSYFSPVCQERSKISPWRCWGLIFTPLTWPGPRNAILFHLWQLGFSSSKIIEQFLFCLAGNHCSCREIWQGLQSSSATKLVSAVSTGPVLCTVTATVTVTMPLGNSSW